MTGKRVGLIVAESITILGSTGSIGTQALEVAQNLNIRVHSLAARKSIDVLENQVRKFMPEMVAVFDEDAAKKFKSKVSDTNVKVVSGMDGILEIVSQTETDTVLNAMVGMEGFLPTVHALKNKKNVALANKETLVVGGKLVMELAAENAVSVLPVDSEHSAIFQCLQCCRKKSEVKKLILTASGGPFWGYKPDELENVSTEEALRHPNWKMGAKITIDSATMMNKGLEIIEAVHLFGIGPEKIDVLVHRESVVHSMVEFADGAILAQMGIPSMKIPIQYALTYPGERLESQTPKPDLKNIGKLTFFEPDCETFKCINICRQAINTGDSVPIALNAANEEAVKLFLDKKIKFLQIQEYVQRVCQAHKTVEVNTVQDVLNIDKTSRSYTKNFII
jgi:1-deoxy-D-xylulose-5-phosphate reductoisomerase